MSRCQQTIGEELDRIGAGSIGPDVGVLRKESPPGARSLTLDGLLMSWRRLPAEAGPRAPSGSGSRLWLEDHQHQDPEDQRTREIVDRERGAVAERRTPFNACGGAVSGQLDCEPACLFRPSAARGRDNVQHDRRPHPTGAVAELSEMHEPQTEAE
jgi:hypothetical protein